MAAQKKSWVAIGGQRTPFQKKQTGGSSHFSDLPTFLSSAVPGWRFHPGGKSVVGAPLLRSCCGHIPILGLALRRKRATPRSPPTVAGADQFPLHRKKKTQMISKNDQIQDWMTNTRISGRLKSSLMIHLVSAYLSYSWFHPLIPSKSIKSVQIWFGRWDSEQFFNVFYHH